MIEDHRNPTEKEISLLEVEKRKANWIKLFMKAVAHMKKGGRTVKKLKKLNIKGWKP